ncbi:hypothetical protein Prudu_018733, partial [Prunus dulcis]
MKLLPTGRKNVFYLTIYGSLVSVFLLVGIILAGAALGYWIVRRFVVSKDGTVDVGIAQFVKWAMRIIGTTSILQSTLDTPLAVGALVSCWIICKLISSLKRQDLHSFPTYFLVFKKHQLGAGSGSPWLQQGRQVKGRHGRPEFLSRSSPQKKNWKSPSTLSAWSDSPVK